MRLQKSFALVFFPAIAVVIAGMAYLFYVSVTVKPPLEEINKARSALAEAKDNRAGKYAGESLKEAEEYFIQAMEEWRLQNNTFFMLRDYTLTTELALNSYNYSLTAVIEADKTKNKLKYSTENRLQNLEQKISCFENYYKKLALNPSTVKLFNNGKTKFTEAQVEFKEQEYISSLKLILKAEEAITKAEKQAHLKLAAFYNNYPEWERNTRAAYQLSKKGQTVFLIDKLDAALVILKAGKEYKTFHVEFGSNWMGDKTISGDMATPEGIYKVQEKKGRSDTKYYKALLLDYPNKEDQKKYNHLVRDGKISKGTGIGGLIEIHGEGGKGIHWTDGCVALENKEMDVVFSQSSINTPVIIVGARHTLEEYLN